jgi:hypothetical protein
MDLDLPSSSSLARRHAAAEAPLLSLARGATARLRLPRGARLAVVSGRIWLTERGDTDDHFVAAGGQHVVRHAGPVVLEGDSGVVARVRVTRR